MSPKQVVVSETNRTPIVQIITWLALVASALAFLAHASLKLYVSRSLSLEIAAGIFALILCAAQSLAVSLQAANGFGKPLDSLQAETIQSQFKAEYAATILFVLAVFLSKLVIVAFVRSLSPKVIHRRVNAVLGGIAVLWAIGSVLAIAFACGLPHPWNKLSGKCFSHLNWWYAMSAFNIATEVGLVGLESIIAYELQLKPLRKTRIISIFLCRVCVSIAVIIHLVFLRRDYTGPARDDLSLGYWRSVICQQVVLSLAVITTSLPYAKMFMTSLDSGMIRIDDARRRGEDYSKGSSGRAYELLGVSSDGVRRGQARRANHDGLDTTLGTGISQTKTWTVKREPASDEEIHHKLGISNFAQ